MCIDGKEVERKVVHRRYVEYRVDERNSLNFVKVLSTLSRRRYSTYGTNVKQDFGVQNLKNVGHGSSSSLMLSRIR